MAKSRIDLQYLLENILGSRHVYFQPPETVKMNYPAIVYSLDGIDLPVFLDMEENSQFRLGQITCSNIVTAFCERMIKGGYRTGLYMSLSPLTSYISKEVRERYTIWVAQYYNRCQYDGKYAIWQHSDSARIDGIDGRVDENYLYDQSIIVKGSSSSSTVKKETIDVTYRVYSDGRWLPWVKNLEDYAGLKNKPAQGIQIKVSKGHIRYRVKLIGADAYLPWVKDTEDYAGIYGKNIERVQIACDTTGCKARYRVSTINSEKYLPWVTEYNLTNENGYAGIPGRAIDALQVQIIKE